MKSYIAGVLLALSVVVAPAVSGQARTPALSAGAARDSLASRRKTVVTGAVVGGIVGAAIGFVASRDINLGCKAVATVAGGSSCDAAATARRYHIEATVSAAAAGAALGAVVGYFWKR